jgi:hypothetical protein
MQNEQALERSDLMRLTTTALRSARRGGYVATVASLALAGTAGTAGAQVFTPAPDNATSDNLFTAVHNAIMSADSHSTIILSIGDYHLRTMDLAPASGQTTCGSVPCRALPIIPSGKTVTITSDHADQGSGGTVATRILGDAIPVPADDFSVASGGTLNIDGVTIGSGSSINSTTLVPDAVIRNAGTLVTRGADFETSAGEPVIASSGSVSTIVDSLFNNDVNTQAVTNSGALTMTNDTVVSGAEGGVTENSGGTFALNNTVMENNLLAGAPSTAECVGPYTTSTKSIDDDGSCKSSGGTPVFDSNEQYWANNLNTPSGDTNGGPTISANYLGGAGIPNPPTYGTGDATKCPVLDGRFFINPVVGGATVCDIGEWTNNATQATAGPTCNTWTITQNGSGQNVSQAVNVTDPAGLGPQDDAAPATAVATAESPQPTIGTVGAAMLGFASPNDSATNALADNAAVTFANSQTPTPSPMVARAITVTATKGTAAIGTTVHWHFTAWDWAGLSTAC